MTKDFTPVLSKIQLNGSNYQFTGNWMDLNQWISLQITHNQDAAYKPAFGILRLFQSSFYEVCLTPWKLERHRQLWKNNHISDTEWGIFASSDLDMFHISLRSCMDFISQLLNKLASKPGQLKTSFEDLKAKPGKCSTLLSNDIQQIVLDTPWFDHIRQVRNNKIHFGSDTMVFYNGYDILFQAYKGYEKTIACDDSLMFNDNVINGEKYVAYYIGCFIEFLENLAESLLALKNWTPPKGSLRANGESWSITQKWISTL